MVSQHALTMAFASKVYVTQKAKTSLSVFFCLLWYISLAHLSSSLHFNLNSKNEYSYTR